MGKDKRSFFERLTGTVDIDDEFEDAYDEMPDTQQAQQPDAERRQESAEWMEEEASEGQLAVDVYQTPDEIVIKAIVAGVKPDDLDVSITRDMVTIRGKREESKKIESDNYFYKELYWGSFSRTILLPQEIEVEEAEATEKHGLLFLKLPKIDKEKQTKLKIKSN